MHTCLIPSNSVTIISQQAIIWLALRNSILTKDNLFERGSWKGSKKCQFCNEEEAIDHLFFKCQLARFVWSVMNCVFACGIPNGMRDALGEWMKQFNRTQNWWQWEWLPFFGQYENAEIKLVLKICYQETRWHFFFFRLLTVYHHGECCRARRTKQKRQVEMRWCLRRRIQWSRCRMGFCSLECDTAMTMLLSSMKDAESVLLSPGMWYWGSRKWLFGYVQNWVSLLCHPQNVIR